MNIFVGNFSLDTNEDDLRKAFEPHGEVGSVEIIRQKTTGESRGFAFVEMRSRDEAQAAISALDGAEFMGRSLNVNEARPRVQEYRNDRSRYGSKRPDSRRRTGKKGSRKHRGGRGGHGYGGRR
ncbi:MAG TPA: RNA-binding protein [Acidobacteriota bacterium]|nr:RNA-binding protein [Acidobacteriota bacterium]